jgi:pyruvate dehydrogenase E2 component (dihydrolipoamide acetyltransferase)
MTTFKLPDLGEGLQEAEIVSWQVAVGDHVVADQPLLSVETDKAVVEIPSPVSGRVARLYGEVGDRIAIGEALVDFDGVKAEDAGTVVGDISGEQHRIDEEATPAIHQNLAKMMATPAVRALAGKLGVDLAVIAPSGRGGRVTKADVERVASLLADTEPSEPLRGVRRAMAQRMAHAHAEVVPAGISDEADVSEWGDGADVTIRLIRAIAAGCRAEPALNAWYDGHAMSRRVLKRIDVGIAVDTPDGLIVPVLRDVGCRDKDDLLGGLKALKADTEARREPPEELRGGTITLSNFGVFKIGRFASLVVVPPQVAIIGAGCMGPLAVVRKGKLAVRTLLPLSLTFDHRAVNGGEAARFLKAMAENLAKAA